MKIRQLVESWEQSASERRTVSEYCARLPIHDAAKLAALAEMYPGRTERDIITDLLSAALDDLEAAFPYVRASGSSPKTNRAIPSTRTWASARASAT